MPSDPLDARSARDASLRRAHISGSVVFFANGLVFASLVPRLPEIKTSLELGAAGYGLVIAAAPAGALSLGLLAPVLMARLGTARVAAIGMSVVGLVYALAGISPVAPLFAAAMFVAGGLDAIVDVAQNSHALRVQRRFGRSIITGFHAVWSIGSLTGGALGSLAAAARLPVAWHLVVVAVVTAVVMAVVRTRLLPDLTGPELDTSAASARSSLPTAGTPAPGTAPADAGATASPDPAPGAGPVAGPGAARPRLASRPWFLLAVLALVGTAGAAVEDAGSAWSGVHLDLTLGAGPGVTGLGFVLFTSGMVLARLVTDRVVDAVGRRAVVRYGGVGVVGGMALAALSPTVPGVVAGFALAGIGTAALIPLAMDAADEIAGLSPGVGLTVVSWILRAGTLVSPILVGALAAQVGVAHALLLVVAAGLLVTAAASAMPRGR